MHRPNRQKEPKSGGSYWMYGRHAVSTALANPARHIRQIVATANTQADVQPLLARRTNLSLQVLSTDALLRLVPPGAVHQGMAAEVEPLAEPELEMILSAKAVEHLPGKSLVLVLDQVNDPQNIGAILRSAAAFGANAVITSDRHAPKETAALAKTACGALEVVPMLRVTNIADSLQWLKTQGFWCLGLDAESDCALQDTDFSAQHVALVMGAEGKGIRPRVLAHCDMRVHIPMQGNMESLNVSAAAAVALYHCRLWRKPRP